MKILIHIIVIIILCSSSVFSQQSTSEEKNVTGILTDLRNRPLSNVIMSLTKDEKAIKVTTNTSGKFKLSMEFGEWNLEVKNINEIIFYSTVLNINNTDLQIKIPDPNSIYDDQQPVLIVTAEELNRFGYNTLDQKLQAAIPGFYSTWQIISDGTVFIPPSSLRGFGPDQMLILINGKRRHSSALLNVNSTFGRGTVSNDFNSIPVSMIKRIEVLKNSASVNYGSDAIAGIINIVLKDGNDLSSISVSGGFYPRSKMDDRKKWWTGTNTLNEMETTLQLNFSAPLDKSNKGFIQIGGSLNHLGALNRAGNYSGGVYQNSRFKNIDSTVYIIRPDSTDSNLAKFWGSTGYYSAGNSTGITALAGRARIQSGNMYINTGYRLGGQAEIYAFGGFDIKSGFSTGFYRYPKDAQKVSKEKYPFGFSPELNAGITDHFFTGGFRDKIQDIDLDLSYSIGGNTIDYYVANSNNASFDTLSPSDFYSGSLYYNQRTFDIKASRRYKLKNNSYLQWESGIQQRRERFGIIAGDEPSYATGKSAPTKESGAQVFPGFSPSNEIDRYRDNFGFFAGGRAVINIEKDKFGIFGNASGRYEQFTKTTTGGQFIPKIGFGIKLFKDVNISGEYNEGFRLPSLSQIYFSSTSTQLPSQVVTVNNESAIARSFQIPTLKAERSKTWNFGARLDHKINDKENYLSVNIDYYWVEIKDRIILSGKFNSKNTLNFNNLVTTPGITDAQFFVNGPRTLTNGFEGNVIWNNKSGDKIDYYLSGGFDLRLNLDSANRVGFTAYPDLNNDVLFDRNSRALLYKYVPGWKVLLNGGIEINKGNDRLWGINFRTTFYGSNYYIDSRNPQTATYIYLKYPKDTTGGNLLDREFKNWIYPLFDLEFTTRPNNTTYKGWSFAIGVNNLSGVKSNKNLEPDYAKAGSAKNQAKLQRDYLEETAYGLFEYSRRAQAFGIGGAYWYAKASWSF